MPLVELVARLDEAELGRQCSEVCLGVAYLLCRFGGVFEVLACYVRGGPDHDHADQRQALVDQEFMVRAPTGEACPLGGEQRRPLETGIPWDKFRHFAKLRKVPLKYTSDSLGCACRSVGQNREFG